MVALADGLLTSEKENHLNDVAAKLQIPAREVRKAIEAEVKRVKGKAGILPDSPELEVPQRSFELSSIKLGTKVSGKCVINNVGGGNLQGSVRYFTAVAEAVSNSDTLAAVTGKKLGSLLILRG